MVQQCVIVYCRLPLFQTTVYNLLVVDFVSVDI